MVRPSLTPSPAHSFRTTQDWYKVDQNWYRVHQFISTTGMFGPADFNDSTYGDARFSPLTDPATGRVIPTIYAAASIRAALSEVLLHNVPTPSREYIHDWQRDCEGDNHLSEVVISSLNLVDLTTVGLKGAGLRVSDLFEGNQPDYPRTRAWALHIWQSMPRAQGLWWMSVRDNTTAVIMLFGDRCPDGSITSTRHPIHVKEFEKEMIGLITALQATMT